MITKMICTASILCSLALALSPAGAAEEQERPKLKPALLVIDVQNIWLPMMAQADRDVAPANINKAIALFRKLEYPVIAVYHSDPKHGPPPGTEPFKFPEWVAVRADDPVIVKAHSSSFPETGLDSLLKKSGRDAVFLCGLSATGCVLATYFGATERGYLACMVKDALLSDDSTHTAAVEDICASASIDEMESLLKRRD